MHGAAALFMLDFRIARGDLKIWLIQTSFPVNHFHPLCVPIFHLRGWHMSFNQAVNTGIQAKS